MIILTQKIAKKDLAAVLSHGHLGKWFEGSAYVELISVSALLSPISRDN
jgi:hypothetical protein